MSSDRPLGQQDRLQPAQAPEIPSEKRRSPKRVLLSLGAIAAVAALGWGGHWYFVGQYIETTDDAYLQADSMTVAPKVGGYIAEVLVADNQQVEAGQPVARLDHGNYQAAADQSTATVKARQADVARAEAELAQQDASIAQAKAELSGAEADLRHARGQVQRYAPLARSGAETEERLADLTNEQSRADATLVAKQAALRAAQVKVGTLQAQLQQAQAQLAVSQASARQSDIDLQDTLLTSPIAGRVADRSVRVGQFAQPGTRLMTIVPVQSLYLTANFKETQIGAMRPGQTVTVHVDALPGQNLSGHVDSISPGTGAQFALLPPSNATGNFTKIVQRVPVRIVLDIPEAVRPALVPGLSVTVDVDTRTGPDAHHG
ncbi:HlyD family secretion protein [Pantoea sp. Tr-811]|uniref:HlyD family secretion protein n=1 Tax=unclassified Pantoea TaxID=2630326 RepID=UPI0014209686|nr:MULTISPECIES: HlyD family secretion protein [unclassified Pantoea]NIE75981.1 HlyD family secretion protein [Pantoea sp. Ap-967]NIF28257.1 HlyD family secretion protein [Pantoea sp. Tr-811]